jgi:hypothetical protein
VNVGQTYVREEIAAPADTVWQLIRDFADISAWTPSPVVRTEGEGVGMIRHIDSRAGYVRERCEALDDEMMTFTYRLLESPWPFENVVTVKLTKASPDTTTIEWFSTFETESEDVEGTRARIETAFRDRFIIRLRESVERHMQENKG